MQIPEIHKSNNRKYYFVKQYPNFVMYQTENGIVECFSYHELGLVEEMIEPPKSDLNVEKVVV